MSPGSCLFWLYRAAACNWNAEWTAALDSCLCLYYDAAPTCRPCWCAQRQPLPVQAPFCIHPKTGKVCVPIDPSEAAHFNPDTVPTVHQLLAEGRKVRPRPWPRGMRVHAHMPALARTSAG
jgi:hypothetical protein